MKPFDPLTASLSGTNLIEASAGTGKTHAITDLYVRLLAERRLRVGQILVVTFTNAATAELRDRLRRRLGDAVRAYETGTSEDEFLGELAAVRTSRGEGDADRRHLLAAGRGFDEAAIFTIHGFCRRVLEEFAFESGAAFDTELIADQGRMLDDVVRDYWVEKLHRAPASLVRDAKSLKVSLDSFARIAAKAVAHADMPVLPDAEPGDSPPDPAPSDTGEQGPGAGAELSELERQARALVLRRDLVGYARRELRRRKEAARAQSFDDLLQLLVEALRRPGGESLAGRVRERFPAALIDEFQDTDPVQYEIFSRVYRDGGGAGALFLIGDPKQSIYAFRGADVFGYLRAKRDAGGKPQVLDINRRSDPKLVRGVNAMFERVANPFLFEGIPFQAAKARPEAKDNIGGGDGGKPPLRIMFIRRDGIAGKRGVINKPDAAREAARSVAGDIVRLLASGTTIAGRRVGPGDVAVLCRTNKQALDTQAALRKRGVPSVLQTESSVFATGEAEEVERVLAALADPGGARAIRAALATVMLGQRAADLARLEVDEGAWDDWVRWFQSWAETWRERGFVAVFRALLAERQVPARLLGFTDGERRLTNILHLMELLHAAESERRSGPAALLHWLHRMRSDKAARDEAAGEQAQIRLEDDADAVRLTTIHKSKGLQYPIVYCPYLWDGVLLHPADKDALCFHDREKGGRLTLDLGSEEMEAHRREAKKEALAEQVRLLYVALTRARHACTIVWGAINDANWTALGYLLHQAGGADAQETAGRIGKLFKQGDDDLILAELRAIVRQAPDCIAVVDPPPPSASRYDGRTLPAESLECRTPVRELREIWRVSSYSGLVGAREAAEGSRRAAGAAAEDGVDHDAGETPGEAEGVAPRAGELSVPLNEFPAGARAGQFFHEVLERLDFRSAGTAALGELVDRTLARFGFESRWAEAATRALAEVVATPFGDPAVPLRLADIARERRLSELEFTFPVAGDCAPSVPAEILARVFAEHGAPPLPPDYAERIRNLGFMPLAGFMKGSMDLVFEAGGRWYLVDYKSNLLGPCASDYRPERLLRAMVEHHYFLQYHLYAVALYRHLVRRLSGYDYDRHFGGVHYLFLRGMAPSLPFGTGVFSARPPAALIERLSEVLGGHAGV